MIYPVVIKTNKYANIFSAQGGGNSLKGLIKPASNGSFFKSGMRGLSKGGNLSSAKSSLANTLKNSMGAVKKVKSIPGSLIGGLH